MDMADYNFNMQQHVQFILWYAESPKNQAHGPCFVLVCWVSYGQFTHTPSIMLVIYVS